MQKRALKRARPVHSCIPCRNKKLKCDRQTPCEMCVKGERPDQCFYDAKAGSMSRNEEAEERPSQFRRLDLSQESAYLSPPSRVGATSRPGVFEDLQARVERLESLLSSGDVSPTAHHHAGESSNMPVPGTVEFKGGRSKFRPLGHKSAILSRFVEAKLFIIQKVNNPRVIKDLKDLRKKFPKRPKATNANAREGVGSNALSRISDLLPARPECDALVDSYFDECQSLCTILDQPRFASQYDDFWKAPPQQRNESSFAPCLLLVVSIASLLSPRPAHMPLQYVTDLVSDWLHGIMGKDLSELLTLQIETLLVYALQCAGAPPESVYRMSGRLIRSAMIAGLQYEPEDMSYIMLEEANVRRRLWTSIVELDLQSSLLCGLPSALSPDDFVCRFPAEREPLNKALGDSLALRLEGGSILRLRSHERARAAQCLSTIEKTQLSKDPHTPPLSHTLFETLIHRSVVSFARPLLEGSTLALARVASTRSSLRVLENMQSLKGDPHHWNFYFSMCSQDIFQSMLITCLLLRVRNLGQAQDMQEIQLMNGELPELGEMSQMIHTAIDTLLWNISSDLIGDYVKDLIVLGVVAGSADHPVEGLAQENAMQQGFRKVLDTLTERAKPQAEVSPAGSGATNSSFADSSLVDFDSTAWLTGSAFNFDFGLPLDQNYGLENGTYKPDNDMQWAAF